MQHRTFQRRALATALGLALFSPLGAYAQAQQEPAKTEAEKSDAAQQDANAKKVDTLDKVTVVGSRISRAEVEGPAPVVVITSEEIKKEGFATVYDALQTFTQNTGNVQNDYDWGQTSVNAYPLNLRNLGPGRTLLMINGHRVADYPMPYQGRSNFANFNNIPTGIVDRIEVLTGAASAIYGSDAMGGVVNVVLKKNIEDHTLRAKWGEATRGGRRNMDLVFSGGTSGDKWSLTYNLQHFDRGVLLAKDRPFMDSEDDKPYEKWGVAERALGIAKLTPYPGLRLRQPGTFDFIPGVGNVTRAVAPPEGACDQYGDLYYKWTYVGYDAATKTKVTSPSTICAQRVFQNWALRTGSKDDSGYVHGTYDFSSELQGWASLGVWRSTGEFNSFLDGFSSPNYWDPRATDLATGATGGARRNFLKFLAPQEMGSPDAFLTLSKELAVDFSAGINGVIADRFNWEASIGRAEYTVKEDFPTYNQGDMFDFFMGAQQGTMNGLPVYTPDYNKLWNPLTPEQTAPFRARGLKKAESWLTQAQFTLSGDLFEGWAGPIGFAAVLEAAKQGYKLTPEPKTLIEDDDGWYTPFGNIEQGGGERNRYAAGLELRVPLLQSLTLDAAGRYDKYDAVRDGAKVTWQAGLEWRPLKSLLLRSTLGTTFRAPDMHYVYAQASSGISDFTDYVACADNGGGGNFGCPWDGRNGVPFKLEDARVNRGGTPDLLYEEGEGFTAGIVWDAFKNFTTSLDYWKISIDNEIQDIDANSLLLTEAYCTRNGFTPDGMPLSVPPSSHWCAEATRRIVRTPGVPGSTAGSVVININPINRAGRETSGFDYAAKYALPGTGLGDFDFGLNYTFVLTDKSRTLPDEPLVDQQRFGIRSRITASVNWNWEKWNATLMMYQKSGGRSLNWGGCYPNADGSLPVPVNDAICRDPVTNAESPRDYNRRTPRRYFNGSVGYQFNDNLKFNLYASNLFDKLYNDKWHADFAYSYDDPVGREVAAEVVYKF